MGWGILLGRVGAWERRSKEMRVRGQRWIACVYGVNPWNQTIFQCRVVASINVCIFQNVDIRSQMLSGKMLINWMLIWGNKCQRYEIRLARKNKKLHVKQRKYAGAHQFKQKCNTNRRLKGFEINLFVFHCIEAWSEQTVQCSRVGLKADIVRHRKQYTSTRTLHIAHKTINAIAWRCSTNNGRIFFSFPLEEVENIDVIEEDIHSLQKTLCDWFGRRSCMRLHRMWAQARRVDGWMRFHLTTIWAI